VKLSLIGIAVGLAGAMATTRLLRNLLFGVGPTDALTLGIVTLALLAVASLACWLPARRATKVE
jgi:putative ABC transport system permease protein